MASHTMQSATSPLLNRVLHVNVACTSVLGSMLVVRSRPLASALGLDPAFLLTVGLSSLGIAAAVGWLLAIGRAGRTFAQLLAGGEVVWVVASVAALIFGWLAPTPLGWWAIVLQADMVAIFAALEFSAVWKTRGR